MGNGQELSELGMQLNSFTQVVNTRTSISFTVSIMIFGSCFNAFSCDICFSTIIASTLLKSLTLIFDFDIAKKPCQLIPLLQLAMALHRIGRYAIKCMVGWGGI